MFLFKSELSHYVSLIESNLHYTIPNILRGYEDDPWKEKMQSFILQGGKRLRPALAMMMADELHYPTSESVAVFSCLEIFHDYLLIHDDVIDEDDIRRGVSTFHRAMRDNLTDCMIHDRKHFGHAQAIIGGDVLYSIAQDMILESELKSSRKVALLKVLTHAMQQVAYGRYKQFLSDYIPLSEITLEYIIEHNLINVTSSYSFLFPLQFGQTIATGDSTIDPELREFANNLGILFQTGDDIIGLFGDPSVTGKSDSGDIIQGKKTIPMYLAYHNAPKDDKTFLNDNLGKKDISDIDIVRIKQIVTDYGLQPTKEFLIDYANRCRKSLSILPYSDHRKEVFGDLVDYLIERDY